MQLVPIKTYHIVSTKGLIGDNYEAYKKMLEYS